MLTCVSVGETNIKMKTQGNVRKTRKTQGSMLKCNRENNATKETQGKLRKTRKTQGTDLINLCHLLL